MLDDSVKPNLLAIQLTNFEGWLRKSDPFFELCRHVDLAGHSVWDVVCRSEDVRDNLDPEWDECVIELSFLCGGNFGQPVRVNVLDHERSGKHVMVSFVLRILLVRFGKQKQNLAQPTLLL